MRRFWSALFVFAPLAISSSASAWRPDPRPIPVATRPQPVGLRVQVAWGGSWWNATVLAVRGDDYLVHYEGWSSAFDEWVDDSRVSLRGGAAVVPVAPVYAARPTEA